MSRIRVATLSFCLVLAAFAGHVSLAASPSQQSCEAAGGTFTKVQGQVSCVQQQNVGKSSNSATTTTNTTGQGNINNKQQTQCSGPGASTSSAHCR